MRYRKGNEWSLEDDLQGSSSVKKPFLIREPPYFPPNGMDLKPLKHKARSYDDGEWNAAGDVKTLRQWTSRLKWIFSKLKIKSEIIKDVVLVYKNNTNFNHYKDISSRKYNRSKWMIISMPNVMQINTKMELIYSFKNYIKNPTVGGICIITLDYNSQQIKAPLLGSGHVFRINCPATSFPQTHD